MQGTGQGIFSGSAYICIEVDHTVAEIQRDERHQLSLFKSHSCDKISSSRLLRKSGDGVCRSLLGNGTFYLQEVAAC